MLLYSKVLYCIIKHFSFVRPTGNFFSHKYSKFYKARNAGPSPFTFERIGAPPPSRDNHGLLSRGLSILQFTSYVH